MVTGRGLGSPGRTLRAKACSGSGGERAQVPPHAQTPECRMPHPAEKVPAADARECSFPSKSPFQEPRCSSASSLPLPDTMRPPSVTNSQRDK